MSNDDVITNYSLSYSLPFPGLRQNLRQVQSGGVYWVSTPSVGLANRLVGQMLTMVAPSARAALFSTGDLSEVLSLISDPETGPADLRSFSIEKSTIRRFLNHLSQQIDRALHPRRRLLILMLDIDENVFDFVMRRATLRSWRNWVENNDCALMIVAYGQNAEAIAATLASESAVLSGLSSLQLASNSHTPILNYQIIFWRSMLAVVAQQQIRFRTDEPFFTEIEHSGLKKHEISQDQGSFGVSEVIFQRSVLEGAPIAMAANWQEVGTWQDLLQKGLEAPYATLVFAMAPDQDIVDLARILYELRQKRADALRLIVREMGHVLRNQELDLLKDCGVSRVIADVNLARFFALLEESQQVYLPYRLTENLELTLATFRPQPVRGIVDRDTFCDYMDGIVRNLAQNRLLGVLVLLRSVPMMTAQMLSSQIRLTRMGDVGCVVDNVLYLFLFGCHPDFVMMVLHRIFELPIGELIIEQQVFTEYDSVEELVMRLRDLPIPIGAQTESLLKSEPARLHATEMEVLFSPVLLGTGKSSPANDSGEGR